MKHAVKIFAILLAAALLLAACNRAPVPPVIDETDAAETTGAPDVTAAPDTTGIPETAAPETKAPETTAKETSAPVTTAHEEAWTVVTPAGCRTAGSEERIVNGAIEQREIPLLGHDIAKDGYCTRCGEKFSYGLYYVTKEKLSQAEPYAKNNLDRISEGNYLIVGRGSCTDTELIIPDYVDGLPVMAVSNLGFRDMAFSSVTMPDTIAEVWQFAFDKSDNLETVVFSRSLKRICAYAFANCKNLTEIRLPDSVEVIEEGAFWMAYPATLRGRRNFTLPENLKQIGTNNFVLDSLYAGMKWKVHAVGSTRRLYPSEDAVPVYDLIKDENGGHYLGSKTNPYFCLVFVDDEIRDFSVHPDTKIIAACACTQLETVVLPEGLLYISEKAFGNSEFGLQDIKLPSTLRAVSNAAFYYCPLRSVLIPASVERIGLFAFRTDVDLLFEDSDYTVVEREGSLVDALDSPVYFTMKDGWVVSSK